MTIQLRPGVCRNVSPEVSNFFTACSHVGSRSGVYQRDLYSHPCATNADADANSCTADTNANANTRANSDSGPG